MIEEPPFPDEYIIAANFVKKDLIDLMSSKEESIIRSAPEKYRVGLTAFVRSTEFEKACSALVELTKRHSLAAQFEMSEKEATDLSDAQATSLALIIVRVVWKMADIATSSK